MDDAADSDAGDDGNQRQQDRRAVFSNDRQQQGEDTDRSEAHDNADDFIGDFCAGIKEFDEDVSAFAADFEDADADEQGEDDDRQNICFSHGLNWVGRNHGHEDLHDGRGFFDLDDRIRGHLQAKTRMSKTGDAEADDNGDGRSNKVE